MDLPIVNVNVFQTIAPEPNLLQKKGAIVTQGGTVLSIGTFQYITQPSDLVAITPAALAITSMAWAGAYGGQVTVTTAAPHGVTVGEQFVTTIAGALPAGYNGDVIATSTGTSTFTYYLAVNPGSETTPGTYTRRGVGDLQAAVLDFFAQGLGLGVYIFEAGVGEPTAGVGVLSNFIAANVQYQQFYAYLVPRNWDGNAAYLSMIALFDGTTAKTYFFTTATIATWPLYTGHKCVFAMVQAPVYGPWPANVLTDLVYSTGVVTATTTTNHGVAPGDTFTLAGNTPTAYNGTFTALPGTTGTTLTYALRSDPGMISVEGSLLQSIYTSDGVPADEFTLAAAFRALLNISPSTINRVAPFAFTELVDVTPFPTMGNSTLLTTLKNGSVNYIGNGSEGGIANDLLYWGKLMDGRPMNYWYAVDAWQINVKLDLANEAINGSNNNINPLYYEQRGIDRLQLRAQATMGRMITYGLALGSVIPSSLDGPALRDALDKGTYNGNVNVNAVPFTDYTAENPTDYTEEIYNGISITGTPLLGFLSITVNIDVTDFVGGGA